MRHNMGHRKLNRGTAARWAMLRGLATQLIELGAIVTTVERAKELRKVVEPLVSLARADNFNNRRRAATLLYTDEALRHLFHVVGPANRTRPGGYTRVLKLGRRAGDQARRALIEFVEVSAFKNAGDQTKEAAIPVSPGK